MSIRMKQMPGEHPEFYRFWAVWQPYARKNDGRGDASDTFSKWVKVGYDPEDIILGATWHVRSLSTPEEKAFIQLATTWLNKRGFLDKCDFERDRIAALEKAERTPANNDERTAPKPDYEARAAQVERMKAKMRGAA